MRFSRAFAWSALLLVALTGCSAKSKITSKRSELEPRLASLRDARKNAAAFKPDATAKPADVPLVVSRHAPDDDSNTIVITDQEIDDFDRAIDCDGRNRPMGPTCAARRFGVGNGCLVEIASVLKFGRFREEDSPPHKNYVQMCIDWLPRAKYVLVDLASAKPLGKITFDEDAKAALGGEVYTKHGRKVRYVTESASSVDELVRASLGGQLAKTFPSAKVDHWVN